MTDRNRHEEVNRVAKETTEVVVTAIASLSNSFIVLLTIVVIFTAVSIMTPAYKELLYLPIINGATIAIVYFIIINFARRFSLNPMVNVSVKQGGSTALRFPVSEKEMMRFAIHEAGHLLSLRFFHESPKLVTAFVRKYVSNPNGRVYYEFDSPLDQKYSWAHMLSTLAGQIAETVYFGEHKIGSESDNQQWEQQAKRHLNSGFSHERLWFSSPGSESEAQLNAKTLLDLRQEQVKQIKGFLSNNKEQLIFTAYRLIEADQIKTEGALGIIEATSYSS